MPSKVEIDVIADVGKAVGELDRLGGEADNLGGNMEAMQSRSSAAFAGVAAAAAGYLTIDAAIEFWNFANDVDAANAQVEASFGELTDTVMTWAGDVRREFGESDVTISQWAATINDTILKTGDAVDQVRAADLAMEFTELGNVLANYYPDFENAGEVLERINDALRSGDLGPLEDLGLSAQAAEELAASMEGLSEETKAVLLPAAILGALAENNAAAMEAWAEGADSVERRERALRSDWEQMKTDLAELTEGWRQFALDAVERTIAALEKLEEWGALTWPGVVREFKENAEILGAAFDALALDIEGVLNKLKELVSFGDGGGFSFPDLGGSWIDPRSWPNPLDALDPGQWFNSGRRGGSGVTLVVNAPPLTDPAEVGRHAVEAIEAYERGNGAAWRGAS